VINFRYHVVSLTAVFLALAIGLVVGTAALNGPVAWFRPRACDTPQKYEAIVEEIVRFAMQGLRAHPS